MKTLHSRQSKDFVPHFLSFGLISDFLDKISIFLCLTLIMETSDKGRLINTDRLSTVFLRCVN